MFNWGLYIRLDINQRSDGLFVVIGAALFAASLAGPRFPHFLALAAVHVPVTVAVLLQGSDRDGVPGRVIAFVAVSIAAVACAYTHEKLRRQLWLAIRLAASSRAAAVAAGAAEASATTAARVSKEELSRFERAIAYICHELRNPLHVVGGMLARLEAGGADAASIALEMSSLRSAVDVMFAVTNDLLDLAALRQGKLRITLVPTSLRDVLGACAMHAGAHLQVAREVPDVILVDSMRLRQIVMNGLSNAIK